MDSQARKLTDEQIEQRITFVVGMIAKDKDWKNLPSLNQTLDRLISEQVRREMEPSPPPVASKRV